ncbi:hypothetical protein [Pseudomonas protegens]|uniref:hypothetical protein n=1 Tax=Pseudomonas protegens TaxID=380021 RepID=UPI0039064C5F
MQRTTISGIEIGGEWSLGPIFKASAKLIQSFSHTTTSSSGWYQSITRTVNVLVPVKRAVALSPLKAPSSCSAPTAPKFQPT